jgi:glycine/D-amino acid oxidase-like deaminating enzyme
MNALKEKTIWKEGLEKKDYPQLVGKREADVVIVGAGMAGIISAYLLTRAGKRVIVLEQKEVGSGATHYTTAFLTQIIDTDLSDLVEMFGTKNAKLILKSHQEAIDLIEEIAQREAISCDFLRCSDFNFTLEEKEVETLQEEFDYMKKLGVGAEFINQAETKNILGFDAYGAIEVKNQAKFQPMKFLYALAERVIETGGEIFEHSEVTDITPGERVEVQTKEGTVSASYALVTTYEPFNKPLRLYFKKAFYTSYVLTAHIPKNSLGEAIYEDTDNPYHYIRVDKGEPEDTVIIGGEDHRSDIPVDPEKNFAALREYADMFLKNIPHTYERKWKGPILEPVDGLAYIGPLDQKNILYAMAFSGNGMTYSGITAQVVRDYILKNKNQYQKIYETKRIPTLTSLLKKGRDYGEELFRGALKNTFHNK